MNIFYIIVSFFFISGILSFMIGIRSKILRNYFAIIVCIIEFMLILTVYPSVSLRLDNEKLFSVGMHLKNNSFGYIFALIAAYMWFVTAVFSREYFVSSMHRNRYYLFMLFTGGATISVFLSNSLLTTYIFFEIMSVASFVMVIHEETKEAMKAASTYLTVAIIGGLLILFGIMILNHSYGDLSFDALYFANEHKDKSIYIAGILIMLGFGAKAGMFPLHIWLPSSHPVAPAPASALLSGILVKTGIFGIAVISSTIFYHDYLFNHLLMFFAVITMLLGAFLALFSVNLKRILACSSMSQMGFILLGISCYGIMGDHGTIAVRGSILHMVNHAFIKLVLFCVAGIIYINTHKLSLNDLRGYGKDKPFLKFLTIVPAFGLMGIPLFNGYASKTLIHESIVELVHISHEPLYVVIEYLFILTGGFTFAYMLKLIIALFYDKPYKHYGEVKIGADTSTLLTITTFIILIFGIFPNQSLDKIANMGEGFFRVFPLKHEIEYLSLINLKGSIYSIIIGLVLYFMVVKKYLIKNGVYIEGFTKEFLVDRIYRPLLLTILPFIGAFIANLINTICKGGLTLILKRRERMKKIRIREVDGFFLKSKGLMIIHRLQASMAYSLLMFGLGLLFIVLYVLFYSR